MKRKRAAITLFTTLCIVFCTISVGCDVETTNVSSMPESKTPSPSSASEKISAEISDGHLATMPRELITLYSELEVIDYFRKHNLDGKTHYFREFGFLGELHSLTFWQLPNTDNPHEVYMYKYTDKYMVSPEAVSIAVYTREPFGIKKYPKLSDEDITVTDMRFLKENIDGEYCYVSEEHSVTYQYQNGKLSLFFWEYKGVTYAIGLDEVNLQTYTTDNDTFLAYCMVIESLGRQIKMFNSSVIDKEEIRN